MLSDDEKLVLDIATGEEGFGERLQEELDTAQPGSLGADSVDTAAIQNGAVTSAKIADGTIQAGDLASNSVTTVKILNANVTLAKLASGIAPSHVVKFAGKFTTVGGDANEQASVSGVVAGDIVVASLQDVGVSPVTLLTAKAGTDVVDFVMSDDPSNDHVINYLVLRAAA